MRPKPPSVPSGRWTVRFSMTPLARTNTSSAARVQVSQRPAKQWRRPPLVVALGVLMALVASDAALAHRERPATVPSNGGRVPAYRTMGPYLVVCKNDSAARIAKLRDKGLRKHNQRLFAECRRRGFEHIQAAVDAVEVAGTRILVLPGVYREEPSLAPTPAACAALAGRTVLSYQEQISCPHVQNLVAILGDGPDADAACDGRLCGLQVEGTGASPDDVVVDGRFERLNVIRADRADGAYVRNLTVQHASFNGLYVVETDGFAIDRVTARWNDEYGFLTFAVDHGLYASCEAHGNGEAGIYPGSAADLHGARPSVEIRGCRAFHNTVGLAGTAGDSMHVHDNDFFDNSMGIVLDSLAPGHPGVPQNSTLVIRNRIWQNNQDFERYWRDGSCERPSAERGYERGVVCPVLGALVGTGVVIAGGNANELRENRIWDNWRFGAMQLWVPATVRGETDPSKLFDTSHLNRYQDNRMGLSPSGRALPNGVDFWWDEEGAGNCWQGNVAGGGNTSSDPAALPDCLAPSTFTPPNPVKFQMLLSCVRWLRFRDPTGCALASPPTPPEGL